MTTNTDRIAEIRERLQNTTGGVWRDEVTDDGWLQVSQVGTGEIICSFGDMESTTGDDHDNARFIGHAPTDITWLLMRCEYLEDQLNQAESVLGKLNDEIPF